MKLACTSASVAQLLAAGNLTQLEWLDWCAAELSVDGIVFVARHFPRTDADYLAQLKKMACDLGLTVAALDADEILRSNAIDWFDIAIGLGAPIVIARAPPTTHAHASQWSELVARAKRAASLAKTSNVTIGLRNAAGTLCATASDLRRLQKDVDSSWIRFAPDFTGFGSSDPPDAIAVRSIIATLKIASTADDARSTVRSHARLRGFLAVESDEAADPRAALIRIVADLRRFAGQLAFESSVEAKPR